MKFSPVKTALLAWFEIICGLVIYSLYKLFFSDDDDVLDLETSDSTALFAVADRLSKLYDGAKVYVGLRIPDADTSSPQPIDLVLLNKGSVSSLFFSPTFQFNSLTNISLFYQSINNITGRQW